MSESEPSYAKTPDKAKLPWYNENFDKYLTPEAQEHLEVYSGIPRDQQSQHVHKIRDQAWAIRAYPCTGLGIWPVPYISRNPGYSAVLSKLKAGGTFLDIGVFLGGDMRKLVYDGAASSNMYGIDIVSHWDVGFDLYKDREKFKATFIESDILKADEVPELVALQGKVDVISFSAVMHQWSWENQVAGGKAVVKFSSGPGALLVGYQIGNPNDGPIEFKGINVYKQNPSSWARLWEQIGSETGTKWKVEAALVEWDALGWDPKDMFWMAPEDRPMEFVVTRLE